MMLTIQLNITGRNYILKYIKIENSCLGEHKTYFKTFKKKLPLCYYYYSQSNLCIFR